MRLAREMSKEEIKMDLTPMIDVIFQLILFFLCNIKYKTLEGRLEAYLPKDIGVNAGASEQLERVEILLRVIEVGERRDPQDLAQPWSGRGTFEYVGRKLGYQIGPRRSADLAEVQRILAQLRRENPERRASIDCRPGTIYNDMIPVLDAAVDAGFEDITFVGEHLPTTR